MPIIPYEETARYLREWAGQELNRIRDLLEDERTDSARTCSLRGQAKVYRQLLKKLEDKHEPI